MNLKLNEILIGALLVISPIIGTAQVKDGVYSGTLQCGPLLTNPIQGPWTQTINLTVNANNLSWERSSPTFSESGNSSIQAGRVSLNANGAWNASARNTGGWKTVAMLNLEGEKLVGLATIFSDNGVQRLRDCTVSVIVKSQSTYQVAQPSQIDPKINVDKLAESRIDKTFKQITEQATNKLQHTTDAALNRASTQAVSKVQEILPTLAITTSEIPTQSSVNSSSKGKLFSSKTEFFQKIRAGQFQEFSHSNSAEKEAFADSVRAILRNDFGVLSWPTDKIMKNGTPNEIIARGCQGEFEYYVEKLFFQTVWTHAKNLPQDPKNISDANVFRMPKNSYEFSGQERKISRETIDASIVQLQSLKNGWCAKDGVHPYQSALLRLFTEFDRLNADIFSNKLTSIRASYQEKFDRESARVKAEEIVFKENAERHAAIYRKNEEQKARVEQERQTLEKGAADRNAQKIKALGFSSTFANAALNVNYMGRWSMMMPVNQWLGLLIENKKIESVKPLSTRGLTGVSIKKQGQPAVGFLFRIEGKDAYAHAMVLNDEFEVMRTPSETSQLALLIKTLTDERNLN